MGTVAAVVVAEEPLLDPALLARLEWVQLGTRRRLAGRFSGEHRSRRYGTSLDFADYRDYHPGDDFRRIDYALYARTDELFIRLFEAEDDLTVRVLLDASSSMGYHGKLRQAARLAGAMAFIGLVRRDVVQLTTFPDGRTQRYAGRGALPAIMHRLEELEADGGTDVAGAAAALLARRGPPGLTVVISDLLTPTWPAAMERLPAGGGDVTIVHVLADEELHPDLAGDLDLVDAETGERMPLSLSAGAIKDYEQLVVEWTNDISARCRRRGIGLVRVSASDPIEDVLLRTWRREGLLR